MEIKIHKNIIKIITIIITIIIIIIKDNISPLSLSHATQQRS